jgi:hypothetical protein
MGNRVLDREIAINYSTVDFDHIEKRIFKENLTFQTALNITQHNIKHNVEEKVTYLSILKDYVNSKYSIVNKLHLSLREKRERRIQKMLNLFFYICLAQVTTLNMCTFVFFNWDIMEPITTCITYCNIVAGFYFWASTSVDYEIESMLVWLRTRKFINRPPLMDSLMKENEEIKNLIEMDATNNYDRSQILNKI